MAIFANRTVHVEGVLQIPTPAKNLVLLDFLFYADKSVYFCPFFQMVFIFSICINTQFPHSCIVSVSDLYIPKIGPPIFLQQNRQTDCGNI